MLGSFVSDLSRRETRCRFQDSDLNVSSLRWRLATLVVHCAPCWYLSPLRCIQATAQTVEDLNSIVVVLIDCERCRHHRSSLVESAFRRAPPKQLRAYLRIAVRHTTRPYHGYLNNNAVMILTKVLRKMHEPSSQTSRSNRVRIWPVAKDLGVRGKRSSLRTRPRFHFLSIYCIFRLRFSNNQSMGWADGGLNQPSLRPNGFYANATNLLCSLLLSAAAVEPLWIR